MRHCFRCTLSERNGSLRYVGPALAGKNKIERDKKYEGNRHVRCVRAVLPFKLVDCEATSNNADNRSMNINSYSAMSSPTTSGTVTPGSHSNNNRNMSTNMKSNMKTNRKWNMNLNVNTSPSPRRTP